MGLGRTVGRTTAGALSIVDGSGGGGSGGGGSGGGGGGGSSLVAVATGVVTGVVVGTGAGSSPFVGPRKNSRTTETTIADSAVALAISRVVACRDRYHGVDKGLTTSTQLFSSNASNASEPSRSRDSSAGNR